MAYHTILAYLPDADSAGRTLKAAAAIARQSGAHLIGLYVKTGVRIYYAGSSYYDVGMLETMLDEHNARHDEQSAAVKAMFDELERAETFPCEWRLADTVKTDAVPEILNHCRSADLVVCPNTAGDKTVDPEDADTPVRLLMEAGRPVVVIPAGWNGDTIGKNVTVAYNASREATRAVFDALPLLKGADNVHAVWVDPALGEGENQSRAADEIAVSLARHGVKVSASVETSGDNTVARAIVARARDDGADLIVMGAYGHMRLREMIFGGVSRDLLNALPLPVLMSH
ncbi:MAG: universal stress protein [Rhodobiaceae bacterium]|nr:universal stress protein [Rhodobiaceae bacterium]MCC0015645.1 universal stress protein [Rhodobiaceae bacterium]MCC0042541.1 universal stress protein [Rhodobiaceae bacterium]